MNFNPDCEGADVQSDEFVPEWVDETPESLA